ncbi:MAG TPA: sulfatase [Vicinamibacterales bacterium]|nr:sulfatase [Vicinamibacterales bacterium]
MKRAFGILVAFAVLWLAGREVIVRVGRATPRPASVILITLDTTRADRLPPYNAGMPLPAIEGLAREGVVFNRVVAPVPLTLPSHSSLFTGRLPPAHGARVNAERLGAGHPLFTERLREAGYRTAAFVGSVVLNKDRGLGRGFDVYDDVISETGTRRLRRPASEVIDAALAWLNTGDASPFFMWVHLFDAHAPYAMPEAFDASPNGDPYTGAIAIMDAQIGRLLRAVDERKSLDRTAVIVTADHGESLGDHGERGHGIFVYESALRVPLIVRWPGVQPRRVSDLAQLIDIAPTVLDLEGLPAPPMDGVSLAPLMRGDRSALRRRQEQDLRLRSGQADRIAYAESMYPLHHGWSALRSVREGRFKFIEAPRPELYDLESDPHEARNIYDTQPATAARLLALLRTFGPAEIAAAPEADAAARERLAALGYASPTGGSTPSGPPAMWPDPKDMIAVYNDLTEKRMKQRDR